MASISAGAKTDKPSFAKIAASGIKPSSTARNPNTSDKAQKVSITSSPRDGATLFPSPPGTGASTFPSQQPPITSSMQTNSQEPGVVNAVEPQIRVNQAEPSLSSGIEQHSMDTASLPVPSEESSTQVSSSSGSAKPPSLDGKSVASGTTFALDEKESLRPDDSASVKATEDDDLFSPPSTGLPGSRAGSDDGVRAFREQLREISGMDPSRRPGPPPNFIQSISPAQGVLYVPPPGLGVGAIPGNVHSPSLANANTEPAPDPKLLEALDSPKDRIMVLKLEQDIVDFVKDPKESSLKLPQTNAFYRMLAHRLADYYMLGHVVDESTQAVRIYKTMNCRLPPPLTDIATPSTAASTPPPLGSQMKILRRGDISGRGAANGSNWTSKTTSENGESGNEDDKRAKALVTREEREARYEAARKRIMGSAKPADAADEGSQKDYSRPSSTTGRKTTKKKQRADSDDDFEARSAYSTYYPQSFSPNPTSGHGVPNYGPAGNAMPQVLQTGQDGSVNGFQQFIPPGQNAWPSQPYQTSPMQSGWPQSQQPGYDLSGDFQRAMSLHSAVPSQPPNPHPGFNPAFGAQYYGQQQQWPQQNMSPQITAPGPPFGYPSAPGHMLSPAQSQDHQQYAFGQLPSQAFPGRPANSMEHPLPGSYKSKHFNPQSQSFIPGQPGGATLGPGAGRGLSLNSPGHANAYALPTGPQQQFSSPLHHASTVVLPNTPVVYGSPQPGQHSPATARTLSQPMTHPLPQPVFPRQPSPNVPLPPRPETSPLIAADPKQQHGSAVSTAQPTNPPGQSTIAKWGTPASLPPKPPPSAEPFDATKFAQVQRQPPTHNPALGPRNLSEFPTFGAMPALAGGIGIGQQSAPGPRRT